MKKYEFTGVIKKEYGIVLNQIRLLVDLPYFKKGSIGGWIDSEKNLSHERNCWVSENGQVFGNGRVYENGQVSGNGLVYGNGQVFGNGRVFGVAVVRHRFFEGVCVNVCTEPFGISYSGFEEVEGKKVHYVSVGCQDHTVENWLNETYRNQIISSNNFPKKKVETFLKTLDLILELQGIQRSQTISQTSSTNRCSKTGRFIKKGN